MREIVVPLASTFDASLLVRNAIDIGRKIGASVSVGDGEFFPHRLLDRDSDRSHRIARPGTDPRVEGRRNAFRRCLDEAICERSDRHPVSGNPPIWIDAVEGEDSVWDRAIFADLIVVRRPTSDACEEHKVATHALRDLGRPVLAIPHRTAHFEGGVAIAWNGSDGATAALRSAVEVLKLTAPISVLQVGPLAADATLAMEAVEYLHRHGKSATVRACAAGGGSISDTILRETGAAGAGLLVAGAGGLGTRKQRESVSLELLLSAHIPVFLGAGVGGETASAR